VIGVRDAIEDRSPAQWIKVAVLQNGSSVISVGTVGRSLRDDGDIPLSLYFGGENCPFFPVVALRSAFRLPA
jgi:hypothetical protein